MIVIRQIPAAQNQLDIAEISSVTQAIEAFDNFIA
jgi:hypothetical protein